MNKSLSVSRQKSQKLVGKKRIRPTNGGSSDEEDHSEKIKRPLADQLLFGELTSGGHIKVTVEKGELVVKIEKQSINS